MTPRESLTIATAALRWSRAHAARVAASAEKRVANLEYQADLRSLFTGSLTRSVEASARVTKAKARERAAMTALAKACAAVRSSLDDATVIDATDGCVRSLSLPMSTDNPQPRGKAGRRALTEAPGDAPISQSSPRKKS